MKVNSVNLSTTNCCDSKSLSFKAVYFHYNLPCESGVTKGMSPLFIRILKNDPTGVFLKENGMGISLGTSEIAKNLSKMIDEFGGKIANNEHSLKLRAELSQLISPRTLAWFRMGGDSPEGLDFLIKNGTIIPLRESIIVSNDPRAIDLFS